MSPTRRAFSLLEVMLSLVLLSGMMAVVVPWSVTAAMHAERRQGLAQWEFAAIQTLDLIERDFHTWDHPPPDPARRARVSRAVEFDDRSLRIPVRAEPWRGQEWAVYTLDPRTQHLERDIEPGPIRRQSEYPILGDLELIEIARTPEDRSEPGTFTVRLNHTSGLIAERILRADEEEQP